MKAYKFKLKTAKSIQKKLQSTLDICRELYNAGLQERRDAYKLAGKSINYHDQRSQLPNIKESRKDVDAIYSQVLQDVLRRLSKSFDAFFQRIKEGAEKAGYPRFKGKARYDSFSYPQSGFRLVGDKLHLSKIGSMRLRLSRPIEGRIKTCAIKREADGWYVIFACEVERKQLSITGKSIGVDLGIESFATLSDGEKIENPHQLKKSERKLKKAQRRVSGRKLRSKRRGKAAQLLANTTLSN